MLGIDYGERRIGVALSDPTASIAQPLPTVLRRRGKRPPFTAILDLIGRFDVGAVVVGLPLTLAGDDSDWTREVRDFAAALGKRSGIRISLLDERMTSVLAERTVRSLGLPRHERERKERIDSTAAMLILQAYLNSRRSADEGDGVDDSDS